MQLALMSLFKGLRALDAMDCDGIGPMVLKHCAIALYQPFYHLFSLSFSQHYLPSVLPVLSGVPQGSILGPLLFIVFVNDLPSSVLSSSIFLFADDAKCVIPVSSITDYQLLQNNLTRLVEWSTTWNLLLNEDKCSVSHLTANQFPLTYNYSISGRLLP